MDNQQVRQKFEELMKNRFGSKPSMSEFFDIRNQIKEEFYVKSSSWKFCMEEMKLWNDNKMADGCGQWGMFAINVNYKVMRAYIENSERVS